MAEQFATIDEYIGSFPEDVRVILQEIRRRIRGVVPDAAEIISYRIPTVTLGGKRLVYFAGWKTYISVYPVPTADESVTRDLAPYLAARSTARFPLNKPIPFELIERMVAVLLRQRQANPD